MVLVELKRRLAQRDAARPKKLEVVTYVVPGSDDVTYTHAVFGQCFLPIRKLPKAEKVL